MGTRFSLLMLSICLSGSAQTLDTAILGLVTDPGGAAVPGAAVTITQTATNQSRTTTTSPSGQYEVRYLQSGEYTVEVKAQGFQAERRTLTLQIGQQARVNFPMQVGNVVETVDIVASSRSADRKRSPG